ncbi:MAG: transglycosylase SLT domain-containing protein [Chloroflexota bacterium]|nr:transglycosylase SLT domain-containing protein [Chloroflexota bacterium]
MSIRPSAFGLLLGALLLSLWLVARSPAVADNLTPTAGTSVPVATALLTPSPETLPQTPTPTPIQQPQLSGEDSTPIATTAPSPTSPPTVTPVPIIPTALPDPAAASSATPTPTPAPIGSAGVVPGNSPLPSAADLRLNARLRWGTHVPGAVRQWAYLIVPAARLYHLNPNLIAAVMTMESNGDPLAWSDADARGLMQVLHGPWDPRTNVFLGVQMLAGYFAEFHDWSLALAAYNAGPGAVLSYNGIPPYRETRDYVIIVEYLFDLFDHHRLTHHRTVQYTKSLLDLRHYAAQRKKVARLAAIGHVTIGRAIYCRHFSLQCGTQVITPAPSNDPFWPVGNTPDPLLRVNPFAQARP